MYWWTRFNIVFIEIEFLSVSVLCNLSITKYIGQVNKHLHLNQTSEFDRPGQNIYYMYWWTGFHIVVVEIEFLSVSVLYNLSITKYIGQVNKHLHLNQTSEFDRPGQNIYYMYWWTRFNIVFIEIKFLSVSGNLSIRKYIEQVKKHLQLIRLQSLIARVKIFITCIDGLVSIL
jgi:hypothetical protein